MWQDAKDFQTGLIANLRADLHNTSARQFGRTFEAADFLPGAAEAIEEKAAELVRKGMSPAAAAAIASSKQSKEAQIGALNSVQGTGPAKGRGKQPAAKRG